MDDQTSGDEQKAQRRELKPETRQNKSSSRDAEQNNDPRIRRSRGLINFISQ